MTAKLNPIGVFLLLLLGQSSFSYGQSAKLLQTVSFTSVEMKEGNPNSVVKGSVDVHYWSTFNSKTTQASNQLLLQSDDIFNLSLSNFKWEKVRWGLGRTQIAFQGNRFPRENPTFRLNKLSDGSQFVETDQSVFLDFSTSAPQKIEFQISPRLTKACSTAVKLKLKLYVIKKNNAANEDGKFERVTQEDILVEIPFTILPPNDEDEAAWKKGETLQSDIFAQTAALQQYLATFGDCGKYTSQATDLMMKNEDRLCQTLDAQTAESYLELYQKLGWEGQCVSKANSILGTLNEEDFFQKALNNNQLADICDYLSTYGDDPNYEDRLKQLATHLNEIIAGRWEAQFGSTKPQAERDKDDCHRFLAFLNVCSNSIMEKYIDKRNARYRWLARLCVRSADRCELLWQELRQVGFGEKRTRMQREYCDACFQKGKNPRYWEVLAEVKPKIVPLQEDSVWPGYKNYSFQLSYFAPRLDWLSASQWKAGEESLLDTLSQIALLASNQLQAEDEGKILIYFDGYDIVNFAVPTGLAGEFSFLFVDSLGKIIDLNINTSLNPLRAELLEGWFEGEYRIKLTILGGDSLLDNGQLAYRLIFQHLDDPEISFAYALSETLPDEDGIYVVDKSQALAHLAEGQYELTIRDGRNDETHEVRIRQALAIKHGGIISRSFLKIGLASILFLLVLWLAYANIRVAQKAKKK